MRSQLKSNNTIVLIGTSPAFKTVDETGSLFSAVQNSSYRFQMNRQSLKQVGTKSLQVDTINRHPDVDLSINYLMSPTMQNEENMGFNFANGYNYKPTGLLANIDGFSNNFYFYNHPEEGADALDYFNSPDLSNPNNGEVIALGNAYLNSYSASFSNGGLSVVSANYKCSNIESTLYTGVIKSPAINLQSGNALGVGNIDLANSILSGTKDSYSIDYTKPTVTSSACNLNLSLENLQVGGQPISNKEHILQDFQFGFDFQRVPLYGLGSDYVYDRKIQYPIQGSISISSLVNKYDEGFVSGMLNSEQTYEFEVFVKEEKEGEGRKAVKFIFNNVKLESFDYSLTVNQGMVYNAQFKFLSYGEKGLDAWPFILYPTIVFNSLGGRIRQVDLDIPANWSQGDLNAASLYLGNEVNIIGSYAFDGCSNMTGELNLPDSILEIQNNAFQDCYSFTGDLFFPGNLQEIGSGAFYNCYGLNKNITFGKGISTIGDYAFYNCNSLNGDLKIQDNITTIGSYAFANCSSFNGKIIIGDQTSVGLNAFQGCNFNTLELSDSVVNVQDGTFDYWSNSGINLSLPLSIKTIGDYSFDNYAFVGDLNIPKFTESIGKGAFLNCVGFDGVLNISGSRVKVIDNSGFENCSNITGDLTFPNSLTGIGDSAFYDCKNLGSNLNLNTSLVQIGNSAFENCSGFIGDLTIFDTVNSVGDRAFANCSGLNGKITLSYETNIGVDAFDGCSFNLLGISDSLLSVNDGNYDSFFNFTGGLEIGDNITLIGDYAFDGYDFGGSLFITDKVTGIGIAAFSGCDGFTGDLNVGLNLITLGDSAFSNCISFDGALTLSDSLKTIGSSAFLNCYSLVDDLIIKDNVVSVGDSAFENCYGLDGFIQLGDSLQSVGNRSFANCNMLVGNLVIPDSLVSIGDYSFSGCASLNGDLDIGNAVTNIGDGAFEDCSGFDQSLKIGTGITIGNNAFDNCEFSDLTIKETVKIVNDGDFDFYSPFVSTSTLTTLNGIRVINDYAFSGYAFTGDLALAESITGIGISAFQDSSFNGQLSMGSFVDYIDDRAFKNTVLNGDLAISDSLVTLGDESFYNCTGFTGNLNLTGGKLLNFGDAAFYNCHGFNGSLDLGIYYGPLEEEASIYTKIGKSGFKNCYNLTGDLHLHNRILLVDDEAFRNCSGFNGEIIIQSGTTGIGNESFYNCNNLNGLLYIPASLDYLGDYAFGNCDGFYGICISNNITSGIDPFFGCDFKELCVPSGTPSIDDGDYDWYKQKLFDSQSSLVLEESLSLIGTGAFDNFGFTGDLILPNSLTGVESGAFKGCAGFSGDLDLGTKVDYIGPYAFSGCSFDGSLIIGSETDDNPLIFEIPSVSVDAFEGNSFSNLTIREGVTGINDEECDFFSGFAASLTLPSTISGIYDKSFDNYNFTGELVLPDYLEEIGRSGFYNCDGFTGDLNITGATGIDGVSGISLRDHAFENCTGFNGDLFISDKVTIGAFVFDGTNFNNIEISGSGLKVDDGTVFIKSGSYDVLKNSVNSIEFHDNLTGIGEKAFLGYNGLTGYLNIPCSLVPSGAAVGLTIGDYAFSGCNGFDSLRAPGKAYINYNDNAFTGCNFTKLILPNCVSGSGVGYLNSTTSDYDFYKNLGYDSQSSLEVEEGIKTIYDYNFSGFGFTGDLITPSTLSGIDNSAFYNCTGLKTISINTGVSYIGDNAFRGCSSITGVRFSGSGEFIENQESQLLNVGSRAFKDCTGIVYMDLIPENVQKIGSYAFENCSGLSNSYVETGNGGYFPYNICNIPSGCFSVGAGAFKNTYLDGDILLAGTGAALNAQKFENCSFRTLYIPPWCTSIPKVAYSFFPSVANVNGAGLYIDEGCGGALTGCFENFGFTGSLNLPSTWIGSDKYSFKNAFTGLSNQGSLTFSDLSEQNTMLFEDFCFQNCVGFTGSLIMPSGSRFIRQGAFSGCENFNELILPTKLQEVSNAAFMDCSGFSNLLTIPDEVTNFGDNAFKNCSNLISYVVIPDSTISIGDGVFQGCTSINDVYINQDSSILGANAFSGPGGTLYVTSTHIASYGGAGASYDGMTVAQWNNYPSAP